MKGIILAGGTGSRLQPITTVINKHLMPIYSKPMIYYPLSTLMLGGIDDILIISTPESLPLFEKLLGDGSRFGIKLSYTVQTQANGIAEAFILASDVMDPAPVTLILGDNLFFGAHLQSIFSEKFRIDSGARIFAYAVDDPGRFGVVTLDDEGNLIDIVEKPDVPKSSMAATGLYVYDAEVFDIARSIAPSERGELEITAVNDHYLSRQSLKCYVLPRGSVWIDAGTIDSLMQASDFVRVMEHRTRFLVNSPEEVALAKGFISMDQFREQISGYKSSYYDALRRVAEY